MPGMSLQPAPLDRPSAAASPPPTLLQTMIIHLLDGTYELFRHFYGLRSFNKGKDKPFGAVTGVLHGVLEMIEQGATHIGVATDHVIESFRNELWPDYKTGDGIERPLLAQFHPLEEALAAMGVAVWPMVELEADDALASAAHLASADEAVEKVCIWTPDKDLAQCVRDDRVVQVDRRAKKILNAEGVRKKFGVEPALIPDFLALVGDSADGYPGIPGIGEDHRGAGLSISTAPSSDLPPKRAGRQPRPGAPVQAARDSQDRREAVSIGRRAALAGADAGISEMAERLGDVRLVERCRRAEEKAVTKPIEN